MQIGKSSIFEAGAAVGLSYLSKTDEILQGKNLPLPSMSHKISEVFMQIGWREPQQHLDVIKLLGITRALPDTIVDSASVDDSLMTDSEAFGVLQKLEFDSKGSAFKWLLATTQDKWIRKTAANEGVNKSTADNLARWFMKDEGALFKNKESLLAILTNLGFVQGSSWNDEAAPAEILLMGGLDDQIKERIGSLKQVASSLQTSNKPLGVCYLTGPRGAFNFEKSLAGVLALQWFEDASLEGRIQSVLSANEKNGWTNDVLKDRTPQMKLLLLAAIGRIDQKEANALVKDLDETRQMLDRSQELINSYWPASKGCFYRSPEKYDPHTAGWPVATDLAEYYLTLLQIECPETYDNLYIVPVVTRGKSGRLANTADTVEQWIADRGPFLSPKSNIVSLSSQPHTLYMHETALACLKKSEVKLCTVSESDKNPEVVKTIDAMARLIFTLKDTF